VKLLRLLGVVSSEQRGLVLYRSHPTIKKQQIRTESTRSKRELVAGKEEYDFALFRIYRPPTKDDHLVDGMIRDMENPKYIGTFVPGALSYAN
tara:strand:+ start:1406 stop:1684 length:279 start_codon:yes stop_codon:yes gene_type:complete